MLRALQLRLYVVGLTSRRRFDLPLTQIDLAECLGLTNVLVNCALRALREKGLATSEKSRISVVNRTELWRAADFNPRYLYLPSDRIMAELGP